MNTTKEDWIDSVLHMADTYKRPQAPDHLHSIIQQRIQAVRPLKPVQVWAAAAALLLLLAINITAVRSSGKQRNEQGSTANELYEYYAGTTNDIYEQR